ncbi:MAG: OB-fold nucleic acid binding domain-containing protein, partial [Acidilobaceae archaeon]
MSSELKSKIQELVKANLDPYVIAYSFPVTIVSEELKSRYAGLSPGEETGDRVSVAGRIWHVRRHGGITFLDVYDQAGRIQVILRRDIVRGSSKLELLSKLIDKGDIIGVKGRVVKTKTGEVSVLAEDMELL